jgi:hypothetical protein
MDPDDLEGMEAVTEGFAEFMAWLEDADVSDFEDILRLCYRQGYADGYTQAGEDIN